MRRLSGFFFVLLVACAATGDDGVGDRNLPSAGVGPFRKLATNETRSIAPFVFEDKVAAYRDPCALVVDDGSVVLYAIARRGAEDVIVRTRANDARTFFGTSDHVGQKPEVVLEPTLSIEGTFLSGPAVVQRGNDTLLFYASAGGIHSAISTGGGPFRRFTNTPILSRDAAVAWETDQLRSPSAYLLPDGRVRLFYTSGTGIGEAESDEGVRNFKRLSLDPVLGPEPRSPALLPNEKPPFDERGVADPHIVVRTTPAGRKHVRMLYTGKSENNETAIGFAARYGDGGPFTRQPLAVYSARARESAPTFVETRDGTFLYIEQDKGTATDGYRAIAAGFAPATATLPEPADYPASP